MNSFDPASLRQAVAEFTPLRPQKFQELLPAKDVIAELRQKRASYRSIAVLLTQHCLPTSKTAIAAFCHEILGEVVRPRRKPGRKRMSVPTVSTEPSAPEQGTDAPVTTLQTTGNDDEQQPARTRGPRIAQVRMLNSQPK